MLKDDLNYFEKIVKFYTHLSDEEKCFIKNLVGLAVVDLCVQIDLLKNNSENTSE